MKAELLVYQVGILTYWFKPAYGLLLLNTASFNPGITANDSGLLTLLIDDDKLMGIFSERDYARKIILKGKNSHETLVKEIMTENVISVSPDDNIEKCMELMSEKKIRHLPVMKEDKVVGVISITDVVTAIIAIQKETISHLHEYISQ